MCAPQRGNSPRTLLEELACIQANDVILLTHTHGEVRLRCVTQPVRDRDAHFQFRFARVAW